MIKSYYWNTAYANQSSKKYIASAGGSRVLLLLFPRNLHDEGGEKENPKEFIAEAVRKYLTAKE
jgi:hypothetical protein